MAKDASPPLKPAGRVIPMQVDYFKNVLVPVVGRLGVFMLGLELMSEGIQKLGVNRSRSRVGHQRVRMARFVQRRRTDVTAQLRG
jgi:hypothetical protein